MKLSENAVNFSQVGREAQQIVTVFRTSRPLRVVLPRGVPQERIPCGGICHGDVFRSQIVIDCGAYIEACQTVDDHRYRVQRRRPPGWVG